MRKKEHQANSREDERVWHLYMYLITIMKIPHYIYAIYDFDYDEAVFTDMPYGIGLYRTIAGCG